MSEKITPETLKTLNKLIYAMSKESAKLSFIDFIEEWEITEDAYESMKSELSSFGINKFYC